MQYLFAMLIGKYPPLGMVGHIVVVFGTEVQAMGHILASISWEENLMLNNNSES
jgi:hypothetical protein